MYMYALGKPNASSHLPCMLYLTCSASSGMQALLKLTCCFKCAAEV